MVNLAQFREQVTIFRKRQVDLATGRPYTLEALAKAIGLSADELGHRLRGTGRSKLTADNVLTIVRVLAEWETLSWEEAVALLVCMDYPLDQQSWQTDLQHLLGQVGKARWVETLSVSCLRGFGHRLLDTDSYDCLLIFKVLVARKLAGFARKFRFVSKASISKWSILSQ